MTDGTDVRAAADSTAVRVALWRALHARVDPLPRVISDEIGLLLVAPDDDWRGRPDMDIEATALSRAGVVTRARFVEDLVLEQVGHGVDQYVILGAGLDTFAQRNPDMGSALRVFEVDQPGASEWKRRRLVELGFGVPEWLRLVPVDFEVGLSRWWAELRRAGFDDGRPAVVASTGVSMYLTRDAISATLAHIAALAPGSTLAMTFMLPLELLEPAERRVREEIERAARSSGTPFISFFVPEEMVALARNAGFGEARHVSAASLAQRYFADRTDGLRLPDSEQFLVATTR